MLLFSQQRNRELLKRFTDWYRLIKIDLQAVTEEYPILDAAKVFYLMETRSSTGWGKSHLNVCKYSSSGIFHLMIRIITLFIMVVSISGPVSPFPV